MIQEYDIVSLIKKIPGKNIPLGSKGTVLVIYQQNPGVYEVEFTTPNGQSFGTATVEEESLHKINENK